MDAILSDTSLKLACVSEVTGCAWRSVVEDRVTIGNERGVRSEYEEPWMYSGGSNSDGMYKNR